MTTQELVSQLMLIARRQPDQTEAGTLAEASERLRTLESSLEQIKSVVVSECRNRGIA